MATKDTNNSSLLSKVAKFVRNPTKDWNELDQPESEQADSGYSKQALKEMIERKRQNDFVRKREFDHLRKLRRREPTDGTEQDAGRPSFFQSSLPSNPDERATTLKKIDEIEAQMSKQWWKGKQADAGSSTNFPVSSMPGPISSETGSPASRPASSQVGEKDSKFAITEPSTLNPDLAPDLMGQEFAPTQLVSSLHPVSSQMASSQLGSGAPSSMGGGRQGGGRQPPGASSRMTSGFSSSQLFATELGDGGTDPDLEEAAIRFANGDDAGAEAGLLEALRGDGVTPESAEVWMAALFDLYRATNQQQRFDAAGVDFAQRFGRSSPAWFSMPDLVGLKAGSAGTATTSATWVCPAELDMMAIIDLRRALREQPLPWRLNWTQLRSIKSDAGAELGGIFVLWCQQQVSLGFESPGNLEKVLRSFARSGDKAVAQYWWQLLMDALRVMRLQDEFELVALDYCVTYEVSPPAWTDARCEYQSLGQHHAESRMHNQFRDTQPFMESQPGKPGMSAEPTGSQGSDDQAPVRLELAGEILGDAAPALEKLEVERHGSERLVVSCAKLIRVDFSAAGSILNWVAQRQNEGCHIQFREVHRLVAAFFNVIGINEHARIVPRSG